MSDEQLLPEVEENPFAVAPKQRERPYLSTSKEREIWMKFNTLERAALNGRVKELNGRVEQVMSIYVVHKEGLYLVNADKMDGRRQNDSYFREWLEELASEGVPYGNSRMTQHGRKWAWDEIEGAIEVCLSKGLSLEISCKVAIVGSKALDKYLENGVISINGEEDDQLKESIDPPRATRKISRERQVELLVQLANARSSRGATMIANAIVGNNTWIGITNMWREKENVFPGYVDYNLSVEMINTETGEKTPYEFHLLGKDVDPKVVRWMLAHIDDKLATVAF